MNTSYKSWFFVSMIPASLLAVACADMAPGDKSTSQEVQVKYPNTTLCGKVSAENGRFLITEATEPFLVATAVSVRNADAGRMAMDAGATVRNADGGQTGSDAGLYAALEFGTTPEDGASLHLLEDLAGRDICLSGDFNGGSLQVVSAAQIHQQLAPTHKKCGIVRKSASGALALEFSPGLALALAPEDGSSLNRLTMSYLGKAACVEANWRAATPGSDGAAVASAAKISKP